jgi:hypothetical protein
MLPPPTLSSPSRSLPPTVTATNGAVSPLSHRLAVLMLTLPPSHNIVHDTRAASTRRQQRHGAIATATTTTTTTTCHHGHRPHPHPQPEAPSLVLICFCRPLTRQEDLYGKTGKRPILLLFVIHHSHSPQLYEDLSTWRSEIKKTAVIAAPRFYNLTPAPGTPCPDPNSFSQDAATELLRDSMFLRDGRDDNVSLV